MSEAASPTPRVGIVVIGRNEGENLRRCLLSIPDISAKVVYSDSGSTDGSIALAEHLGAFTLSLDRKKPFTAARGRNEGFNYLMHIAPETEYVQFIDGDCELALGWVDTATKFLQKHTGHAIVCGHLLELSPHSSIYNRLCALEWDRPVGNIESCGGIFMVRTTIYDEIGGMNSLLSAGEEPEMCLRLRKKGWLIARINTKMALHDADLKTFFMWWKRAVRSGQASYDVYSLTDGEVYATQVKRTRAWTLGWVGAILLLCSIFFITSSKISLLLILTLILLYPLQIVRMAARMTRGKKLHIHDAIAYGFLLMISKWAEIYGQASCFIRNNLRFLLNFTRKKIS